MGNAGSLLAMAQLAGGAAQAGNSLSQAGAYRAQGNYAAGQYDQNAANVEETAQGAYSRGNLQASKALTKGSKVAGDVKAAAAAQGLDVNSGSPADLQDEATYLSSVDALNLRYNALNDALGLRKQAASLRSQGKMAKISARNSANQSIISGGMQFAQGAAQAGYYANRYRGLSLPEESSDAVASRAMSRATGLPADQFKF